MDTVVQLMAVVGALAVLVAAVAVPVRLAGRKLSEIRQDLSDTQTAARAAAVAIAGLTAKLAYWEEQAKIAEGFFTGLVKVCEAQVAEVVKLREAVDKFTAVVVRGAPGTDDAGGFESYDEVAAGKAYARQQYIQGGMSEAQANIQVGIDEKKILEGDMNPVF